MSINPIDLILSRVDSKATSHGRHLAHCPAHPDKTPSLAIGEGEGGRVLLHCYAGCEVSDIVASLGLEMGDLFLREESLRTGARQQDIATIRKFKNKLDRGQRLDHFEENQMAAAIQRVSA